MKIRKDYTCPLELVHDIIRGKWKPIILWQLGKEPASLSGLKKEIKGISQKMLLEHLKELQEFHIVSGSTSKSYPLKSEYSLTPRGRELLKAVTIMQSIGIDLMSEQGMKEFLKRKGFL